MSGKIHTRDQVLSRLLRFARAQIGHAEKLVSLVKFKSALTHKHDEIPSRLIIKTSGGACVDLSFFKAIKTQALEHNYRPRSRYAKHHYMYKAIDGIQIGRIIYIYPHFYLRELKKLMRRQMMAKFTHMLRWLFIAGLYFISIKMKRVAT